MTSEPVGGLKTVAIHGLRAAQMRVGTFYFGAGRRRWLDRGKLGRQFQNRKVTHTTPKAVALPVIRPAVIPVIVFFVLARHRLMHLNRRAVLNLLAGQLHEHGFAGRIDAAECVRRKQHLPPRQPVARIRDDITHRPSMIVKIKIFHLPDVAIRRAEFASV